MSRTYKDMKIRVDGKRRKQPDVRRLARVLIELAQAQAEADAQRATDDKVARRSASTSRPRRASQ